jgi:hypothetical protein
MKSQAVLPPMVDDEIRIVLARARIDNEPTIEAVAPKEIRVKKDRPLRVQFLYHVEESSKAKEEWRFMLRSTVGKQEKSPIKSRWGDRWGLPDRFWGTLEQTFTFEEPGTYPGGFTVHAEYDREAWAKKEGEKPAIAAKKELAGKFVVHVDP